MSIHFVGKLAPSKSIYNRALVVKSFLPSLQINGSSSADDVVALERAIDAFSKGEHRLNVGQGGTVLRFLALRVAREKGMYQLVGSERLMARPQEELERVLAQLGCQVERTKDTFAVRAFGWHLQGDGLYVRGEQSSQFVSAIILSAWGFDQPLFIHIQGGLVSSGYLKMTIDFVKSLGMNVRWSGSEIYIPAQQRVQRPAIDVESDMSSSFSIAAFAAVKGQAHFSSFPEVSLQPDSIFPEFLERMGVKVMREGSELRVAAADSLKGSDFFIEDCPDTFPVLAALCFLAEGASQIRGGSHLKFKESDRLGEMAKLLTLLGRKIEVYDDGLGVLGEQPPSFREEIEFDPIEDHRLAMAAALLNYAGFHIKIKNKQVVNKSFPEFWKIIGDPG